MQIDSQTPQDALERLYGFATRREMLQASPLNFKLFLRYALLFILFPGMVGGFWVGLGATLVFCVALLWLLGSEQAAYAELGVQVWLVCGVCAFVWVCVGSIRSALALRRLRNTPRVAEQESAPAAKAPACAEEQALRWRKSEEGDSWSAELVWQVPEPGIYAVLLTVRGMGRRRLLTLGRQGVCTVHTAYTAEGDVRALLLYKLEPGRHTLRWALHPRAGAPPHAGATLLSCPH